VARLIDVAAPRVSEQLSAASRFVMAQAITPSTRRTYAAPLRSYADFCRDIDVSPEPCDISVFKAGEWLAHLAIGGTISGGTLKGYRSALSTAWEESGAQGPNPLQSALIERHMRGASRILLQRDVTIRDGKAPTLELTPRILALLLPPVEEAIRAAKGTHDPLPLLCWAAACFGVFGLLRPSEFLGVGYRRYSSHLTAASVRFFVAPEHEGEMAMLPKGCDVFNYPFPDRFDFALGPTKADQLAKNGRVIIAAPMCVQAVWRWMHARRARGHEPQEPLFVRPDRQALSRAQLLKQLKVWLTPILGVEPVLTGKCFRRGGASGMLASGAGVPAIMRAGRWKSAAMVGVYSSAESQRVRAADESRALDPTAVSAAAATPAPARR
jgi:hypothetical protein